MEQNNLEPFKINEYTVVPDLRISAKLYKLAELRPEEPSYTNRFEWDDRGFSELFTSLYGDEIAYCEEWKSWVIYDVNDSVWKTDFGAISAFGRALEFTRVLDLYVTTIKDEELREKYQKSIARYHDVRGIDRIVKGAKEFVKISATSFDANPYLINCKNGTYDLRDFTFKKADPADYITKQTNFSYTVRKDSRCERWEQFIKDVTENDDEKARYLQKALGYSMLGTAKEECLFILHGKTTRNGKSTLLNTIETMMGGYGTVAPVELLMKSRYGKQAETASPVLATLKGTRFVTMAESSQTGGLDEEVVKQFTGGEEISARALYEKPVTFVPQFTLWLSCNDLPYVSDQSLFYSKRLRVIEFNRHFSQAEQDKNLKTIFMSEKARKGIFAWLIEGYKMYLKEGLIEPESIEKPMRLYNEDNDTVAQFLNDKMQKDVNQNGLMIQEIYRLYKPWCKSRGLHCIGMIPLANELERHPEWFVQVVRAKNGVKTFVGLVQKGVV